MTLTLSIERPLLKFYGSIIYVQTEKDVRSFCKQLLELPDGSPLGFDMEWPVDFTSRVQPKTAVIQICPSPDRCYIFHLSRMKCFPLPLTRVLTATKLMKIGANIRGDLLKLQRDFSIPADHILRKCSVDVFHMAKEILNCNQRWNLDGLVRFLLHHRLDKAGSGPRMSNWAAALDKNQLSYAAIDAYATLEVYRSLKEKQVQNTSVLRQAF